MNEWFDFTDNELENNDEYIEKMNIEDSYESEENENDYIFSKKTDSRPNAYLRNRKYKKKQLKKFLSLNPGMDFNNVEPLERTYNAIYISSPKETYSINHANHLFLSKRGNIEQYRGWVLWTCDGGYVVLTNKDHSMGKITNRRIRYEDVCDDDIATLYSIYKKRYSPVNRYKG